MDFLKKQLQDLSWWVQYRDPSDIYKHHPSFLKLEFMTYFCALLTLIHALRNGGRFKWLWLGVILHGLVVEAISYNLPEIDNFWHAQGTIMFLGGRLPLYIVVIYAVFLYTASVAVAHWRLKWWAEPFAVGLTVVLIDLPYDICAVKHMAWTWHDTDPNIYDRMYWAPWTSYYFHASFACGFTFAFHGFHRLFGGNTNRFQSKGFFKEVPNTMLAGMLGFPLGTLQFLPNYHILHDNYNIHTEVCVAMFFVVYITIVWKGDRAACLERSLSAEKLRKTNWLTEITLLAVVYFTFFIHLVVTGKPEDQVSIGLHEVIGPCNETVNMTAASGQILTKRKYLCLDDYDEDYFDFHCIKGKPPVGKEWYTVCGTPYRNHMEYIVVVGFASLFGLYWIFSLIGCGGLPRGTASPSKEPKAKQN
ncbi:uncharacterized protein [Argopecten irradians]|uniref:uncharacterized protein isoform X2 n=1 Tax=Argopecten irradians TaxID=31199 RepID=UPI0037117DDA